MAVAGVRLLELTGGGHEAHTQPELTSGTGELPMIHSTQSATHGDFMALNIRNAQAEELAAEVARLAGETKTEAVTVALRERLARLQRRRGGRRLADELDEIALHCSRLPVLDSRTADEILGYDDHGLPR